MKIRAEDLFNGEDLEQIASRGARVGEILSQIEIFKSGTPPVRLLKPCTVNDGITLFGEKDLDTLGHGYSRAALSGRALKFVPASGAASRMVKTLSIFYDPRENTTLEQIQKEADKGDHEHRAFMACMTELRRFAFYGPLKEALAEDGHDIERLLSEGRYRPVLEYLLTSRGLHLSGLPKGLIPFHRYPDHTRSAFEEQMAEAAGYVRDRDGVIRIHFTVSEAHERAIRDHIETVLERHAGSGTTYRIGFSSQKASTDTIAVDRENRPFRDRDGNLLFRPGGHGALLGNLNDLKGDIVFIKNIDNVVPDRLKETTIIYKKALGGYLIELQKRAFGYLNRLTNRRVNQQLIRDAFEFLKKTFSTHPPEGLLKESEDKRIAFLISRLNRPLRVCGMVRNEGEPGGGPFWVEHGDGSVSLQIVESPQVEMASSRQKEIWESSTHFNPVDLVCGIRDYSGKPFNLMSYRDPNTGFVSTKSQDGKDLKALELPGLWNGAMAYWNTVFVEVPIITFNPVKTVLDLLRPEHQEA